jgi:hypothetical protein
MFGHKSLPARIYAYGAKPPVEGMELVERLMRQAHRYRNALVHLELKRRDKLHRALRAISPEFADLEKRAETLGIELESVREEINSVRAQARKRINPEDLIARAKEIHAEMRKIWPRLKEARIPVWGSTGWHREQKAAAAECRAPNPDLVPPCAAWVKAQNAIHEWANKKARLFRKHSGLNQIYGTYLMIESSIDKSGYPPRFHRWNGDGHLTIQIQKKKGRTTTVPEAFVGNHTQLRIDRLPEGAYRDTGKKIVPVRSLCKTRVHFRVGSDKRNPVWAVIPVILHRPMPADASITWVHLIRRKIGTNFKWEVQFTLAKEEWIRNDVAQDGAVGIDVGWRIRKPGNPLRVAYWAGSDGQHDELVLPPDWMAQMRKTEDIQGIMDTNFDTFKAKFHADMDKVAAPEWLKAATSNILMWRSQDRMARIIVRWRDARFAGDEELYAYAEEWRKRYCHLYNYASHLRDQLWHRREDIFRCFAARIRTHYRIVVIELLDLRKFHKLPKAEEDAADPATREYVRDACISELLKCLKESVGPQIVEAPPKNTTKRHHSCGSIEEWDHKELVHTCSKCRETYDQDYNAALNLLDHASAGLVLV